MARSVVAVSLDPELRAALREFASSMNMNESQTIRYVLRRAFDTPELTAALIEEVNGVQHRFRLQTGKIRRGFQAVLESILDEVIPQHGEEFEQVESRSGDLPALPARGEDIVEGEVEEEVRGLGGRRRRRR